MSQPPAVDLADEPQRQKWLRKLSSRARSSALKRGIAFEICLDYAETLYNAQQGHCDISNIPFHMQRYADAFVKYPFAPSIDRILSKGAYTIQNVRLVCAAANFGMGQWGEELFLTIARAAVAYDKEKSLADETHWRERQDERIDAAEKVLEMLPVHQRTAQIYRVRALKAIRTMGLDGVRERARRARAK